MAKANGIYERRGKSRDITYYIRYSYTYRDEEGRERVKGGGNRIIDVTICYIVIFSVQNC